MAPLPTIKKRKHHYVWGHYLRPWAPEGSIHVLRAGNVFATGITSVANRRDFYKPEVLSSQEDLLLRELAIDKVPEHLRKANEGWLRTFGVPSLLRPLLALPKVQESELAAQIEAVIHNFEEDLHAFVEGSSVKHLEALRARDASFFENPTDANDFLHFLCVQYLRTARMENDVVASLGSMPGVQFDRVWKILRHIYALNTAFVLYSDSANWRMLFLECARGRVLLTADQPVINTKAVRRAPGDSLDDLEFYYPLTPNLALLLTRTTGRPNGQTIKLAPTEVDAYNRAMVRSANEQIFADRREVLELVATGAYD